MIIFELFIFLFRYDTMNNKKDNFRIIKKKKKRIKDCLINYRIYIYYKMFLIFLNETFLICRIRESNEQLYDNICFLLDFFFFK